MTDFDNLYTGLKTHIDTLEQKFISTFLPVDPSVTPTEYEYGVKAYCVLSHAAIEEYFETISLGIMSKSYDEWFNNKKYSDTLITLVACYNLKIKIDEDETNREKKCFDYIRPIFEDAKNRHSNDIQNNHGASIIYLRKLMNPVAIDVKDDAIIINSLNQLAKERGAYAHKQTIKKFLSPEDAKKYIDDCLVLCKDIKDKANAKFK